MNIIEAREQCGQVKRKKTMPVASNNVTEMAVDHKATIRAY